MDKKATRTAFRNAVFTRDHYACCCCGKLGKDRQGGDGHLKFHSKPVVDLDSHHIFPRELMPNGGYVESNGISVCDECHLKAEAYWHKDTWPEEFEPDKLYELISSSLAKAIELSV